MRAIIAAMLSSRVFVVVVVVAVVCCVRCGRCSFERHTHVCQKSHSAKAKNETKKNVSVIFVLENHAQSNI